MKHVQRICQVCRNKFAKNDLNRIVFCDGKLEIDNHKKKCGRALYICNNDSCLNLISKKKIFNRIYKVNFEIEEYNKLLEEIKFANSTNKQN